MNSNIWGDFQICISVPLISFETGMVFKNSALCISVPAVSCKISCLKIVTKFTGKQLYQSDVFNEVADRLRPAQMFSCEFCEIFKKISF